MNIIIHKQAGEATAYQTLASDWYGVQVPQPLEYYFEQSGERLHFYARRQKGAQIHPDAKEGGFQPELWMFDVAEFFIASEDLSRYLEFNLCPNGAWWACLFDGPRSIYTGAPAMDGIIASGLLTQDAWECHASIPLSLLQKCGIELEHCRLAVTAILDSPEQVFLTTCSDKAGEPDFHRPCSWAKRA